MTKAVALLVSLACISSYAQNAPAYVQGNATPNGGASTLAYSSNVTAGDALYAMLYYNPTGPTLAFSDSQDNSWITSKTGVLATNQDMVVVGCAVAGSNGSDTGTFLANGAATSVEGVIYEVRNATCAQDVTAVLSDMNAQASCNSGSLTTSIANDLLIGMCGFVQTGRWRHYS